MTEQSKGKYPENHKLGRRKFVSSYQARNLLKDNPYSVLKDAYKNTIECVNVWRVIEKGGEEKKETSHCKNRWCPYCEAAKMAKAIAEMEEPFSEMGDPYFLTLTARTTDAKGLPAKIELMYSAWRTITKSEQNKRRKISGLRKAECTISPNISGHYHYHFHVLIDGKENAEWLLSVWLKELGNLASREGQDFKKADKGALIELSKYFNKQSVDADEQIERSGLDRAFKRLDVIYTAMRGKRTLQTFGSFKRAKIDQENEMIEPVQSDSLEDVPEVVTTYFYNGKGDWATKDGNLFCGWDSSKMRDENGKLFSEKYNFAEVVKPDESLGKESKTYLDQRIWLNKWPDLQNIG
ncbi:MAG: protein rep [Acinetobacter sp.]|nr:protein rep [Acinetobacter sp.]